MAVSPQKAFYAEKKSLSIKDSVGCISGEFFRHTPIPATDNQNFFCIGMDCRKFFPEVACGLEDPRISMYYDDGLRFLRGKNDEYDLIINDSTDPLGWTAIGTWVTISSYINSSASEKTISPSNAAIFPGGGMWVRGSQNFNVL